MKKRIFLLSIITMLSSFVLGGRVLAESFSGGIYPGLTGCINANGCDSLVVNSLAAKQYKNQSFLSDGEIVFSGFNPSTTTAKTVSLMKTAIDNKKAFAMSLDPKNALFTDFSSKLMMLAYVLYDKKFSTTLGTTQYTYDRNTTALNVFENANLSKLSFVQLANGWGSISDIFTTIKSTFSTATEGNILKVGKKVMGVEKRIGAY